MRTPLCLAALLLALPLVAAEPDPARVFPPGESCPDARLRKPKDLNDYFPFTPPASKEGWNDRAKRVREQALVATGLWPLPEKTPLNPTVHGKIERDGYTVEKVFFASMPGHYVTGNLYRPTAKDGGKRPGVLCPHGHWQNGRFYEANENEVKAQLKQKAEQTPEGARYPLQARCAQLARMGFVVFHYDMVGVADSTAIGHRAGFTDAEAELRGQNFMGLQTWNSVRALDFLTSLADVDPKRIAVTGASGGGTQTFMLCAIDDRPAAAFPAVMVSTGMQGGCVCENCSYLRIGTGNVELAALFAPKPLAMSGANDWTKEIETRGLPELKKLYALLGAEDKVAAKCWPEFGHNYNQVSREFMYSWFSKHVLGEEAVIKEQPFKPVPPKELSVYDAEHPRPADELDAKRLRQVMTEASDRQLKALEPKDAKALAEYRRVVGTALRAMTGERGMPGADGIEMRQKEIKEIKLPNGVVVHQAVISRTGANEAVPVVGIHDPKTFDGTMVLWVHPAGKASLFENGDLAPAAKALVAKGAGIMAPDVFQTGEVHLKDWAFRDAPYPVNTGYAGYTFGYNRPVFAQRVRDILSAARLAKSHPSCKKLHLVGWGQAGVWVAAARALCGDEVARTAVDLNQFRFDSIKSVADEELLPGAVKYGGVSAFLALCAPHEVLAHNHAGTSSGHLSKAAYDAAGAKDKLKRSPEKLKDAEVIEWLMRAK
jgi:dienelactone hydrolase